MGPDPVLATLAGAAASPPYQTGQTIICNFYTAIRGIAIPIALIGMAVAFVAVNARHFRLSRSELQAVGVVVVLVTLATIGFFVFR